MSVSSAGTLRATSVAAAAVLLTPLLLAGTAWERLLRAPAPARPARPIPDASLAVADRLIDRLSRTRFGGVWRDTCLYRSIAQCLILRHYGLWAVVRLGAKHEGDDVVAHAWVETDPSADSSPTGHRVLAPPRLSS